MGTWVHACCAYSSLHTCHILQKHNNYVSVICDNIKGLQIQICTTGARWSNWVKGWNAKEFAEIHLSVFRGPHWSRNRSNSGLSYTSCVFPLEWFFLPLQEQ